MSGILKMSGNFRNSGILKILEIPGFLKILEISGFLKISGNYADFGNFAKFWSPFKSTFWACLPIE